MSKEKNDISMGISHSVSRKWLRERRKDHYYRMAKEHGYRSRAAYKLIQIDRSFRIFRKGDVVVELGAAPGGWSQVAIRAIGPEGMLVGVDLQKIEPIEGAIFIRGDFTRRETVEKIQEILGGRDVSVVISDMSPNISGAYATDHARSIHLAEIALEFAVENLKKGGVFVVKIFEGDMLGDYIKEVKKYFGMVRLHSPKASRASSSEIYLIAKGFNGKAPKEDSV